MSITEEKNFKGLLDGWLRESLTGDELKAFRALLKDPQYQNLLQEAIDRGFKSPIKDLTDKIQAENAFSRLNEEAGILMPPVNKPIPRIGFPLRWIAAAAVVLIASVISVYTNRSKEKKPEISTVVAPHTIGKPGYPGGILYLSTGDSVLLDNQSDGQIATQGTMIATRKNNLLQYSGITLENIFNKVVTPRGRQCQLQLPDGTLVWLNASSSIRYPLALTSGPRIVEVSGEVYMEVQHDNNKPFHVNVGKLVIEDLGTAFNINAYPEKKSVTTTVLKGSASVAFDGNINSLRPGQQIQVNVGGKGFQVRDRVDLEKVVSWKNGYFSFQNADITDVMNEISRWYDVDVAYRGKPSGELFSGDISKTLGLSQLLKGLEQAKTHFTLEDSTRIVVISQ
jgi:transmembrane sensor